MAVMMPLLVQRNAQPIHGKPVEKARLCPSTEIVSGIAPQHKQQDFMRYACWPVVRQPEQYVLPPKMLSTFQSLPRRARSSGPLRTAQRAMVRRLAKTSPTAAEKAVGLNRIAMSNEFGQRSVTSELPIWERLHREAATRRSEESLMREKEVLEKQAKQRQLSSEEWGKRWRWMMRRQEAQKESRSRLKGHFDYQRLLAEVEECTFHPRRDARLQASDLENLSATLQQLSSAQANIVAAFADCGQRENTLGVQMRHKLREVCDPTDGQCEDMMRTAAAAPAVEQTLRQLTTQRLDLLREASRLEVAHRYYAREARTSGIKNFPPFDVTLSDSLRKSKWFLRAQKGHTVVSRVLAEEIGALSKTQHVVHTKFVKDPLVAAFARVRPESPQKGEKVPRCIRF